MSETAFAASILSTLSTLPITRPADSVPDPRTLSGAAPTLAKMAKAFIPPTRGSGPAQGSSAGVAVTLRPLKAAPSVPASVAVEAEWGTSVYEIKVAAGRRTGYAADKIKVLWGKRPVVDSKTLGEVVGEEGRKDSSVELGVMFVGSPTMAVGDGAATTPATAAAAAAAKAGDVEMTQEEETPVAQGQSGEAVLETEEFWNDLSGFVLQRVRDEAVAKHLMEGFRKSWKAA